MENYRSLTIDEITQLEEQGCSAADWTAISVDDEFNPLYVRDVTFHGEVNLGVFEKNIEVDEGFFIHSGIRHAVLNQVTIGDNTLIENIGSFISNYDIGEECCIMNVGRISSSSDATYGQGNAISVQNEGGDGNIILFPALTSQLAALMIRHVDNEAFSDAIRRCIRQSIDSERPQRGVIGYQVKITNTTEITNTIVNDECEISGASRISDCSIYSTPDASTFIGHNVMMDNTIVQAGSSILDGAKVDNCFVGEACHLGKGASAEASIFFANSYLDNGEACAAFCGPFTVSHHKSSLLIGGEYSFYNAGSNTNFSNHAYKMGPIHWGTLLRGSKTASGAHLLWPATIGAFSMCMGKIQSHPDTRHLPFSYLFGEGTTTTLVPGRNLTTVGTWRDVFKWPKRDMRPYSGRTSMVSFAWLNPAVINECIEGKKILGQLLQQDDIDGFYSYQGCRIKYSSLQKGILAYDMAIGLFLYQLLLKEDHPERCELPDGPWTDLCGMPVPESEVDDIIRHVAEGTISDITTVAERLEDCFRNYDRWEWSYAYRLMQQLLHREELTDDDFRLVRQRCEECYNRWIDAIRNDARKEYEMGDVSEDTLNTILKKL